MINLAAESSQTGTFDNPITWINFGVLGLLVLGFFTGWVWTKLSVDKLTSDHAKLIDSVEKERDRILKERDIAQTKCDDLANMVQDKLLPVVGEFVISTRSLVPALNQFQLLLPRLQEIITGWEGESGPRRK